MRITIEQFVSEAGIERRSIEEWIDREWLRPDREDRQTMLSDADAARARFIRDLQIDFGVNEEGVDLVLHLVDQIHGLRAVLTQVRTEIRVKRPKSASSEKDEGA